MEKIGNIDNKIIGFPIIQNQQDFVIGKFSIKQFLAFTKYTNRILNSFDEEGRPLYNEQIQREVENSRVNKIADFLIEDPEASLPTNIVLNIPREVIKQQIEHKQLVEIILEEKVFEEVKREKGDIYITIIDGQHRVRGIEIAIERLDDEISSLIKTLNKANNKSDLEAKLRDRLKRLNDLKDIELVVSFFIDKTIEYQAMIFSTINRTQKRVSQSLVYDLFGLDLDDTPQKTAIEIIIVLNGHKSSPFYNRIKFYGGSYSKDNSPPLSQATMAKSIVNLISENLRESERDRNRKRTDLSKRTDGSSKFLPFRKYYASNQDNKISDILFYYFSAIRETFLDVEDNYLWDLGDNFKPINILQTTVGYEALLDVLVKILSLTKSMNVDYSKDFFRNYTVNFRDIDVTNSNQYTFNNRGKKIFTLEMYKRLLGITEQEKIDYNIELLNLINLND